MLRKAAVPAASTRITSRQNPVVARYRSVARGDADGLVLLDGAHLINEAIDAGVTIEHAAVDVNASERSEIARMLASLRSKDIETVSVTAPVMDALSPVRSSSAIVAIGRRPSRNAADVYRGPLALAVIVCDVQDPGNLGAIVRVAEAGGASGVITVGASADPFGWKALRGSMGSALRLPLRRMDNATTAVIEARTHGCRVVATVPRNGRSLFDVDLRHPTAVLVGGEGPGLPDAVIDAADERVTIPMQTPVESLNAAVTAALVVYEARRQRR
jgi:RNA methyltransferase, TrmH family